MAMKKIHVVALVALLISFGSCQIIGDIFKAGMWTGILVVFLGIGLVIFLLTRFGGRK